MRLNKTIKIFLNYFLGPLLFVGLSISIFQQIRHQPHLAQSWKEIKEGFVSYKVLYLVFAVLLIFVNWGIETIKWKLLVTSIRPIGFFKAYKAVLSGVSFSVALPNRIGEYIGRLSTNVRQRPLVLRRRLQDVHVEATIEDGTTAADHFTNHFAEASRERPHPDLERHVVASFGDEME
ncbi:MAG: hypothetical protein EOO10_20735, partial [Chitinophagaceae bacterium]